MLAVRRVGTGAGRGLWGRRLSTTSRADSKRVLAVGLGNIGSPLAGRISAKYDTTVFDLNTEFVEAHVKEWGTTGLSDVAGLPAAAAEADVIFTCLPNTDATKAVLDAVRPGLVDGNPRGLVWLDATSGRADAAAALAEDLWDQHSLRYLDCAVSGGPAGARDGILAALVGGDADTFVATNPVIECFSDKITHLGPAGSGHLVKAVNNAMLGAHMLIASEGLGAISRSGVDVEKALSAINGSSGRSWVTMQRFPDNILTGKPYGFALGMHCKDMENAMDLVRADKAAAPMLELARCLMNIGRGEWGDEVDHTSTSKFSERANGIKFQKD